jgi:hypothetical protein
VKHQGVVAPEQARAVDAQLQVGPAFARLGGVPKILHGAGCIEQMQGEMPIAKTPAGAPLFRLWPGLWIDTALFVTGYIVT